LGIQAIIPVPVNDPAEIERDIDAFSHEANGGLIVLTGPPTRVNRETIIGLAEHHRLPAIYSDKTFVTEGGLMSYGADLIEQFRLSASYVDRILRGEKPGDLPVQAPTKFELVINSKAANAIRLAVPPVLLARADQVIE
jgi:putative ABC transport system substrate-binding protein